MFSQTKTTGSLCTPAKFIASCTSPREAAPSPKNATAIWFSFLIWYLSAAPTATGSDDPSIEVEPKTRVLEVAAVQK